MRLLRKKPNPVVLRFDLGGFEVRITDDRVDIETRVKLWKQVFYKGSWEYGFFCWLLAPELIPDQAEFEERNIEDDKETVKILITAMYATSVGICHDTDFVRELYALLEKQTTAILKNVSDEEDTKILAEEKALHEGTIEAVQELTKTRKNGRKKKTNG